MNVATIWRTTLERLESAPIDAVCKAWLLSANLTNASYNGMDDFDVDALTNDESLYFTLQVPSTLARDVINTRWRRSIEDILADVTGQPVTIAVTNSLDESAFSNRDMNNRFPSPRHHQTNDFSYYDFPTKSPLQHDVQDLQYGSVHSADNSTEVWENDQRANILLHNRLNPRYTFDTFIVGNSNRLAHAASLTVAEAPGESYNPLFLYGGVGLGKTHLLQAVALKINSLGERKALYLTAERFMYGFASALRSQTALAFKDALRGIDVLVVDDLQFLQGKNSQAEFSHTLNSLIDGGHQVVVAADRPPTELESLDERIRSRLAGGLAVEIGLLGDELRLEILSARVQAARAHHPGFDVPAQVLSYIARTVTHNGRDLEGALNRLLAHSKLTGQPITMELAERELRDLVRPAELKRVRIEEIQRIVARHYNVSRSDLLSSRRTANVVRPRQIAMYLAKTLTLRSLPEIGRRFGGRDHTTVLHAVRKIESLIGVDNTLAAEIEVLKSQLQE